MIRINLLPVRAAQKKERVRAQLSIFFLCILLVLISCGALYTKKVIELGDIKKEISSIKEQNSALQKKIGQVKDYEKKKEELQKKLKILSTLKENKSGPVYLLDELSNSLPEKLWIDKFSEKGGNITISGIADSENTVAEFMNELNSQNHYKDIELKVTQQTKINEIKMQKFTLTCRVKSK